MRLSGAIVTALLCTGIQQAAFASDQDKYEAWYSTTTTMQGMQPQKGALHTYFDGKTYYGRSTDAFGNTSSSTMPVELDSTTKEYMDQMGAKPLGNKVIDGVACTGYAYNDQLMRRPCENWLDNTGHLYYQIVRKFAGGDSTWEQHRIKHTINPIDSELTHETKTSDAARQTPGRGTRPAR